MNLCPRSSESPMKRWMQWTACTAELLGTFVAATAAAGWYLAGQKRQRMLEPKTVRVEYTLNTATLERGRYLFAARGCVDCHGAKGQGREFVPPDWPAAADIRPATHSAGTALARYPNAASFVSMLRTGKRPDGTPIQVMPFESLGQLSDVDAQALYLYLNAPPGSVKQEVGSTKVGGQKSSANTVPAGPGGLKLPG